MDTATFSPSFEQATTVTCESCGRGPARKITVRRHVGLLVLQQFITTQVTACRPCGRGLIRSYTGRTLWQGWWGAISFFFNWFVLAANANAWRKMGAIESPSLSGELMPDANHGFDEFDGSPDTSDTADEPPKRRSRMRMAATFILPGFMALGLVAWGWDATHHDHDGAHSAPASPAMMEAALPDGPFTDDYGNATVIQSATCAGDGEVALGGYTHFSCQLTFDDGNTDDVLVHLLEGDEIIFKSAQ